jgi:hypothetical protein
MLAGQGGNAWSTSVIKDSVLSGNMDESACESEVIKVTVNKKINFSRLAIEYPFVRRREADQKCMFNSALIIRL